jgi:hypothetical protein
MERINTGNFLIKQNLNLKKGSNNMKTRNLIIISFIVIAVGTIILFTNCAQPPTEKVSLLKTKLQDCEAKGARVFAEAEFNNILQQMDELQKLMDGKKYREATVLADGILPKMDAIQEVIKNNEKNYTQQAINMDNEELGKLKNTLASKNIKVLGDAAVKQYKAQYKEFEGKISSAQNNFNDGKYLEAYNLASETTRSIQDINKQIEKSKETKAKKSPEKTKSVPKKTKK